MHCLIGRGMGGILWESEAHCFQFLKKQWTKLDYTAILTYAECGKTIPWLISKSGNNKWNI